MGTSQVIGSPIKGETRANRISGELRFDSRLEQDLAEVLDREGLEYIFQPGELYDADFKVKVGGHWVWVCLHGCYWHGCRRCYPGRQLEFLSLMGSFYEYPVDDSKLWATVERLWKVGRLADANRLADLRVPERRWQNALRDFDLHKYVCQIWQHDVEDRGWAWCIEKIKETPARPNRRIFPFTYS